MSVSGPRFGGETQEGLHFLDTVGRIICDVSLPDSWTHRSKVRSRIHPALFADF
jgi:hypothetical protein